MTFVVRPAVPADYQRLIQIAAEGDFTECDPHYLGFLARSGQLLAAVSGDDVVAYGGVVPIDDTAMVTDLFVAEAARGGGAGGQVLGELLNGRPKRMTFSAQHPGAQAAYRRAGMEPRGRMLYLSGPALGGGPPLRLGSWEGGRRDVVDHFAAEGAIVTAHAVVMLNDDDNDRTVEVLRLVAPNAVDECAALLRAFDAGTSVELYVPEQHALATWLLAHDFVVNDHDVLYTSEGVELPPTLAVLHAGLA